MTSVLGGFTDVKFVEQGDKIFFNASKDMRTTYGMFDRSESDGSKVVKTYIKV
jgi:hypothetical protein